LNETRHDHNVAVSPGMTSPDQEINVVGRARRSITRGPDGAASLQNEIGETRHSQMSQCNRNSEPRRK
jgi:hypothetical protein